MMPQQFVEISEELAKEKGIKSGEKVKSNPPAARFGLSQWLQRGLSRSRLREALSIKLGCHGVLDGSILRTEAEGTAQISLTPTIGDANTMIPETKAFMVNVEKA